MSARTEDPAEVTALAPPVISSSIHARYDECMDSCVWGAPPGSVPVRGPSKPPCTEEGDEGCTSAPCCDDDNVCLNNRCGQAPDG